MLTQRPAISSFVQSEGMSRRARVEGNGTPRARTEVTATIREIRSNRIKVLRKDKGALWIQHERRSDSTLNTLNIPQNGVWSAVNRIAEAVATAHAYRYYGEQIKGFVDQPLREKIARTSRSIRPRDSTTVKHLSDNSCHCRSQFCTRWRARVEETDAGTALRSGSAHVLVLFPCVYTPGVRTKLQVITLHKTRDMTRPVVKRVELCKISQVPASADLEEEGTVHTILLRTEDGRQMFGHLREGGMLTDMYEAQNVEKRRYVAIKVPPQA
eukprot:1180262-Prorocentrum_minimum.AAC.3